MLTIIGIFCGFAMMAFAIWHAQAPYRLYADLPSFLIIVGGTLAATLVSYPLRHLTRGIQGFLDVFTKGERDFHVFLNELADISGRHAKEGMAGLEALNNSLKPCFLKDGLTLIINGYTKEEVYRILEENNRLRLERQQAEVQIFRNMSKAAPAFGMVGTLVGLIFMLSTMGSHP